MLCSRFNLADELTVLLEGMRVQARQLDLMSARALANEAIQDLASFVKTLADEMPQMAMAGTQAVEFWQWVIGWVLNPAWSSIRQVD